MQGEVRCEQPNASLYTFTGNLVLSPPVVQEEQTVPLSQASLLLRGSSLRNTKYVLGTVVFAGHESKVSLSCNKSGLCTLGTASVVQDRPVVQRLRLATFAGGFGTVLALTNSPKYSRLHQIPKTKLNQHNVTCVCHSAE